MASNPAIDRREFLKSVVGASALFGLSGCCTIRHPFSRRFGDDVLIVDPHCHIFNARDLDVYNYAVNLPDFDRLGAVGSEFREDIVHGLASLILEVAPPISEDINYVDDRLAERATFPRFSEVHGDLYEAEEEFQFTVSERILGPHGLREKIRGRRMEVRKKETAKPILGRAHHRLTEVRRARGRRDARDLTDEELEQHTDRVLEVLAAQPMLDFFEGLWSSRIVNMYRLFEDHPDVHLFTPAMLNVDAWFKLLPVQPEKSKATSSMDDQVALYEKISILTGGKVLSFVGYDPRQEIEWKAGGDERAVLEPFQLLESCRSRGCFVGVKLYPPMTAGPANNFTWDTKSPDPTWPPVNYWPAGFGGSLDATMDKLFKWCVSSDTSIMAHTDESCFHFKSSADNGNPSNWKVALKANNLLRVNLAHYGGVVDRYFWRKGDPSTNQVGINDLIKLFPGVYADVADYTEIGKQSGEDRERIGVFFRDMHAVLDGHPDSKIAYRVMYGSDYFMDGTTSEYPCYCHDWITTFQDEFPQVWKRFAGWNAIDFLALRKNENPKSQGSLVRKFLDSQRLWPKWRRIVDNVPV
jgi:hypothetical protein